MSIMNSYALIATAADTVLNPVPTAIETATAPDNLDTKRVLNLLGLTTGVEPIAATDRKDFLEIVFDDENECEPIVSVRDGFEIHYTRNQAKVRVVKRPFRGGWRSFEALCTIATFVRNGSVIGQTVVLPTIENQREADAVLFGTEVRQDEITYI